MIIMKHWRYYLLLILVTAGFFACNKDSDESIPVTSSNINVFQAVPGKLFDVLIDTMTMTTELAYGQSSGYHAFEAKRYDLLIRLAGQPDSPYIAGQISLRNGHYYSVFLSLNNNNVPQALLVEDALGGTRVGFGKMRYINLSDSYINRASRLTIDIKTFTTSDAGQDTARYFRRLSYLAATDFVDVPTGPHSLVVTYPDSTLSLNGNGQAIQVDDQKLYTFIGYGNALKADSFKIATFIH
ncbi:DUF4397 domain-containing protein [Chitinophaga pinensis]|uniref:DUF4397 domain-containing protein n=2 Tax=Chitinophaga pinensis TaxID=79329 RepID=A0A5C6LVA8_9BACT|nr:DUF4397 domain-containing protein [Chitinophaga pinensis]